MGCAEIVLHFQGVAVATSQLQNVLGRSWDKLDTILALIKTFPPDEFGSIYCEREWRSLQPFHFSIHADVAMIVLPRHDIGKNNRDYFSLLAEYDSLKLNLPRSIPIVAWQDLVDL